MPANASAGRGGVAEARGDLGVNVEMDESEKRSARLSMPNLCPGIGAAVGGNNVEQHCFCNRRDAGAAEPPCARLQATACTQAQTP
jgi:hypothetical protein